MAETGTSGTVVSSTRPLSDDSILVQGAASKPISVVIPTRHRDDLLSRCLDCLAPGAQTLSADLYDVVVSDDGSEKTSEAMIRERYPWVRWVAGPRKGTAANRNSAVRTCRSSWIVFTDDDCVPSTNWLKGFYDAIQPGTLVYEGRTTCEAGIHSPFEIAPINLNGNCLWTCNLMVDRQLYDSMGGIREDFVLAMDDGEFRERLREGGYAFPFVPAATIDHPPRPRTLGARAGRDWEYHVKYWYRMGRTEPFRLKLLYLIAKVRLEEISRCRFNGDSVRAFFLMFAELWYVAVRMNAWNRKFKAEFFGDSVRGMQATQKKEQSLSGGQQS